MTARSRNAIGIWRARNSRTTGDRVYLVYLGTMIALALVVPVVRAVWLSANSVAAVAALASSAAPGITSLIVAALWAIALRWGRDRGPALRAPFLTFALASSDLPRSVTFLGPVVRAGATVVAGTTGVAGCVGAVLASHGLADAVGAALFAGVGALVGIITTVAWLVGQVFPRAAMPLALGFLALGAVTFAVPAMLPGTPWGWVGLVYPGSGTASVVAASTALAALASGLVAVLPVLMNRLGLAELSAHAARWESATVLAALLDFGLATATYQARPHVGRRIRAIRAGRLPRTFLIRDAVGAARTPDRLLFSVCAFASAGVLIVLAVRPAAPLWLWGAVSGLLVFAGLGPLTDGLRHAASVASDFPLYGISDERLLLNHALFPLLTVIVVLLIVVLMCSMIWGTGGATTILSALSLGLLALIARIGSALKGPMPGALLASIPSPVGDLGGVVRIAWAFDAVLLSALAGASVTLIFQAPLLPLGVAIVLVGTALRRWRHRV